MNADATWKREGSGHVTAYCRGCAAKLATFEERYEPESRDWLGTGFELHFDARRGDRTGVYEPVKHGGTRVPPRRWIEGNERREPGTFPKLPDVIGAYVGDELPDAKDRISEPVERMLPRTGVSLVRCPGRPPNPQQGRAAKPCGVVNRLDIAAARKTLAP